MSFESKFEEITEILRRQELDVALLEGFSTALSKRIMVHKIVAAKSARDLKYTLSKTRPPILAITGQVTRTKKAIPNAPASLVDIEREGPLLTSRIRRLLSTRRPPAVSPEPTPCSIDTSRRSLHRVGDRCSCRLRGDKRPRRKSNCPDFHRVRNQTVHCRSVQDGLSEK